VSDVRAVTVDTKAPDASPVASTAKATFLFNSTTQDL
jgi:hypothetical protein